MIILEDNTYKRIAEGFIGDGSLRTYGYKSGGELVDFFNKYFNSSDTYGQGFPSRWYYVSEKIKSIGLEKFSIQCWDLSILELKNVFYEKM